MTTTGAGPLTCDRHGNPTRLTCAECGTPICPECLVRTPVGLKCPEHAEAVPTPRLRPRRHPAQLVMVAIAVLAVVGGFVALALTLGGREETGTSGPGGPALPSPDRIQTPQVAAMAADGSGKRLVTNRPLAFDGRPDWSPDGSRIVFESQSDGRRSLWVVQADGQGIRRLTDGPAADLGPVWSPDGTRIAFTSERDGDPELYVMNADGSDVRRITNRPGLDAYPEWTPDGSRIAFVSDRDGALRLWAVHPDGSVPAPLLDVPVVPDKPSFSGDGRRVAFVSDRDGDPEVYLAGVDGTGLTRVTHSVGADGEPAISPDGTRLLFASDRDGTPSVYLVGIDGTNLRKLTTGPRGFAPTWSPDGRSIAYVSDPG